MSTTRSQSLLSALTVISANIEGLLAVKAAILSDFCKEQYCHCLCLQETHQCEIKARPRISGMTLVAERLHHKYGSAIFIRDDLKVISIAATAVNHVEMITTKIPDVVVQFVLIPLGHRILPLIVIGDFISHNTIWGYDDTDNNGESVLHWAESNCLTLIHDAKLLISFNSARWKKGYNPDPIFTSSSIYNMCVKSVLNPIPST